MSSCRSEFIRDQWLKDMKTIAAEAAPTVPAAVDIDVDYADRLCFMDDSVFGIFK